MQEIDYYISLNSPWTYLGSRRFREIARRHGAKVNVKPAKFAEVFAKTGGLPLAQRPPERRAYRMMELKRWRDHLDTPIKLEPKFFPCDEAAATRLLIAAIIKGRNALEFASEIGRALWELDQNIANDRVLDEAAERAGLDPVKLRADAPAAAEADALWDRFTKEALSRGVFGAPSYVLQSGEIFWGQDRLEFLDRELGRQTPAT